MFMVRLSKSIFMYVHVSRILLMTLVTLVIHLVKLRFPL